MILGICFGSAIGLVLGFLVYPDNPAIGIGFGLPIGMLFGLAVDNAVGGDDSDDEQVD